MANIGKPINNELSDKQRIKHPMSKKTLIVVSLALVLTIAVLAYLKWNRVSDDEAIQIATTLSDKLSIKHNHQLSVKTKSILESLVLGTDAIPVAYKDNNELLAFVSRKKKEVIVLNNPDARARYLKSLRQENRGTWPPFINQDKPGLFIDENSARDILLEYAGKIGLPNDVDLPHIWLDKAYGYWIVKWQRKYNGVLFDKDHISISVSAITGEFLGYTKTYNAEPCPTVVKIEKREAEEKAFKYFIDYFPDDLWEKNKDKFELVSADLRIVRPDEYWRKMIPFYNSKSRLAWVVVFNVRYGQEMKTIGVLNKDKSVIYIDAASSKLLDSEINIVP